MAGGLLDLFSGGTTDANALDLNRLVRPPDPLGAALAAMAERFATAGQASRLPVSTLGAIGSALGAAGTAAQTAQTQYLDQATKLEALKRSLRQAGIDERLAPILFKTLAGGGTTPAAPAALAAAVSGVQGAPIMPAAAPGAPAAVPRAPSITAPPLPGDFGATGEYGAGQPVSSEKLPGFIPSDLPPGSPGTVILDGKVYTPPPGGGGGKITNTGLLGDPDTLLAQGGPAAGVTQASFRPDEATPLVAAANGAADRLDPAALRGLLGGDDTGLAGGGERDGLLGPPDELIRGPTADLPVRQASMSAPRSEAEIIRAESGGNPNIGYGKVDLTNAPRDPETGFPQWEGRMGPAGISHAAGKYQFQPGTWAEGARVLGIKDFSPESQKAVYDWTRAKYGDAPWRASEVGGPPAGSGAAAVANALSGAPPLVGLGSGVIPGLNMTPQQVAAFNALYGLAGHTGSPLKEFLDIYYKSPEYLRQSEQEKAAGQRAVTEPSDIRIAHEKAVEDRVSRQLEQIGNARFSLAPNGILVPDGQGGQTRVQATVEQAVRAANGLAVPELGIKGMYPDAKGGAAGGAAGETRAPGAIAGEPTGTLPPGYQWRTSPDGKVTARPIPNTPEAAKAQELQRTQAVADRQLQVSRDVVVNAADRAESLAKSYPRTTTGIVGSKLTGVWQPSADMQAAIETIEARSSLDQLQALRAGSPTGASGLGGASDVEGRKLQTSIANLKQSQSQEQFLANLAIVKQQYIDAVHGPGAYKQMSDAAVLKTQPPPREWKEGQILNYPDGSQHQLTNGQWILIKPPTQR